MAFRQSALLLFSVSLFLFPAGAAPLAGQEPDQFRWDPTTIDPEIVDPENPPGILPLVIPAGDTFINAHVYTADGPGPHPTVIVLRDFPGYETNGDIAHALRRAGYNTVMMGYRGAWGIHGEFSWENAIEDVRSAVDVLRSGGLGEDYRIDPTRIHAVGDGFGGWTALMASMESRLDCVVAVAIWNAGLTGQQLASDAPGAAEWEQRIRRAASDAGPVRSDADALIAELEENAAGFDLLRNASRAQVESGVLIASAALESDAAYSSTLIAAGLSASGARSTERYLLRDAADFSATRIRLARTIVGWFEERCPVY